MPSETPPGWNFEQGLSDLETVVKELESGDLPLEKAIEIFERGVTLSDRCRKELEDAETRVEILPLDSEPTLFVPTRATIPVRRSHFGLPSRARDRTF